LSGADEGADEALDDKISELDLDAYAQLLEGEGKGKRRLMLEDIKRELRTPFRDLRQPWRRPPDSLVFKWLTAGGDNGQIRPRQIVAAKIQRADKYRVFTTTDLGVQGGLHQDYLDVNGGLVENCDEWLREKNRRPPFDAQLGLEDVIECAILKVDPERMRVELSRRDDDVFFPSDSHAYYAATTDSVDACLDVAAVVQDYVDLASQRKKRAQDVRKQKEERARLDALPKRKARRAITHPAYRPNCDYRQAEELLSRMDPGEVILRPSSSGKVALTWAFRQNVYRHVEIDETEKKYKIDEEEYEDLDELLARYVLPMNDLTEDVCRHRKYDAELSDPDQASEKLMALRRAAPSSIPYVLWVDPRYPGRFALTYLAPRASRPKNEWVKVTPEGLELRERRYFATDEVLNYFKRHAKDWAKGAKLAPHRAEPKKQAPAPVPLQPIQQQWAPPPQQQAWGAPQQGGWGAPPPQQGWGAPPQQQQWGAQPPPRPMAGGPQGRGRGTTLPAWMTAQNQ
jgi:transcription elongation factor SPT6